MNFFDLLVCIVLALAVWNGWRRGCILQLCSLAGLFIAVWLAAQFGAAVGRFVGLKGEAVAPGGFVIVLLVALCAAAVVGRALRKLLHFAGLGVVDVLLGIALAVVKYALLLSVLFTAFERMNAQWRIVEPRTLERSKTYRPMLAVADLVFPFVERLWQEASERLPASRPAEEIEQQPEPNAEEFAL